MTPTEIIKTIKEISNILCKEEWSIIDLTLKQFKFPTTDSFNGEKLDYVVQSLQDGTNVNLIDLASHLNINLDSNESNLNQTFWKNGFLRVFISHLASDKVNAQLLKEKLDKYSISGFVAHTDIEPTREWQNEIELALRTCDLLIALMIPSFHESKWTDQEIGVALGRDLLIIPVRMGQDPYGFIGKFQAITFTEMESLVKDIFSLLLKNKKTSKKMAYSLMYKFENSESYAEAKSNFELIKKIDYWDSNLINRLTKSKDNNSQILYSFGLPTSINSLISNLEDV
jgi:hypothetical protein